MAATQKECQSGHSYSNADRGTTQAKGNQNQKQAATQAAQHPTERKAEVQQKARDVANDIASTAKEQGERMASRAKDKAETFLADRQYTAAAKIDGVAEAARRAADTLREQGDDNVASYAETAANQVAALSRYLRDRRPNDLLRDVEDAAARHPAIVYGGLFLAGVAVSRFLKSSERSHGHQ